MKKGLLSLFFLSCAVFVFSQNSGYSTRELLMKNPDVLWIGESEQEIILDINQQNTENLYQKEATCKVLKNPYDRKEALVNSNSYILASRIFSAIRAKQMLVYQDPACTQVVENADTNLLMRFDTLGGSCNPQTFADTMLVIANLVSFEDIQTYKLHQLFYFDKKDNTFGSLPLAIAPILDIYDDNGTWARRKPLFWLPLNHCGAILNLDNSYIQWARQTYNTFNFSLLKPLKSDKTLTDCFKFHLLNIKENAQTALIFDNMLNPMQAADIEKIGVYYNQPSNRIFVERENTRIDLQETADTLNIHFIQEWYWDEKSKKISVYNPFFAPLANIYYNDDKKILSLVPLYFKQAK